MNSQFSTGFVIALVIGIAVGALWPKYGVDLNETVLGRGPDAQAVSYALTNGEQGGRGCSGSCDESRNGVATRGAAHVNSGRGQGGRGCSGSCDESRNGVAVRGAAHGNSGRGQHGRGCNGNCDESTNEVAAQGVGLGNSGRGMGRRGRTTLTSIGREQRTDNAKFAASTTCQKSGGQGAAKTTCSGEENCAKTLAAGRCNASDRSQAVSASKTEARAQEPCQHSLDANVEDSIAQHRGPGLGLGLGLGPGWGRNFEMANGTGPDDEAHEAEKE